MNRLKDWSIRNKIRIPLIIIAVLIVWMATMSYRAMLAIDDEVSQFDNRYFPAISAALNADRDLYQALVAMRAYVELGPQGNAETREALNAERLENYQQAMDRGLLAIDLVAAELPANTAAQYRQQMERWLAHSDQVIAQNNVNDDEALFNAPREYLNTLGERLDELAEASAVNAAQTVRGQTTFQLIQLLVLIGLFVAMGILAPIVLVRPIDLLRERMREIAEGEGDLTARLNVHSNDELGQLAATFNQVIEKLQQSICVVKNVNVELEQAVESLRSVAHSNTGLAEQQHLTIDQVVTAVEEMHGSAMEISGNSNAGADAAGRAQTSVSSGADVSQQANERVAQLSDRLNLSSDAIKRLAEEAQRIASVIDVIRGIAEQTNLLALNAAIEAARAGEQGRGFAVVADEVRALASKTQQSTTDIRGRIENLQTGVNDAVASMERGIEVLGDTVTDVGSAAEAFSSIEQSIDQITNMSIQIAAATEEQTHVVEEINRNLQLISDYSSQSTEQARDLSGLSENLKTRTNELTEVVGRFRV
ncbi:methyl-accepting chemotaxis protein [Salinispirillum marinum]|uniref:Methyl-accepting chemotaxis protein n=2 Tax=Saccharospirillaceae TaxID=255527 RepID=A0ABV8BDL1_9GAMM